LCKPGVVIVGVMMRRAGGLFLPSVAAIIVVVVSIPISIAVIHGSGV
jgi:hypothetical protein